MDRLRNEDALECGRDNFMHPNQMNNQPAVRIVLRKKHYAFT